MAVGILALSYGLKRGQEPSVRNNDLALETLEAVRLLQAQGEEAVVIAQWEVALALQNLKYRPEHIVWPDRKGTYLSGKGVWEEGLPHLRRKGVREVIIICQPALQLQITEAKRFVRKDGFQVRPWKLWRIGHLKDSDQWWTRSSVGLLLYAFSQLPGYFFSKHPD